MDVHLEGPVFLLEPLVVVMVQAGESSALLLWHLQDFRPCMRPHKGLRPCPTADTSGWFAEADFSRSALETTGPRCSGGGRVGAVWCPSLCDPALIGSHIIDRACSECERGKVKRNQQERRQHREAEPQRVVL